MPRKKNISTMETEDFIEMVKNETPKKRGRPKKEEVVDTTIPKKRGRPRKDEPAPIGLAKRRRTAPKVNVETVGGREAKKKETNRTLAKVSEIRQEVDAKIEDEFHKNLPVYIEERKTRFMELLDKCDIQDDVIVDVSTGKVAWYKLTEMLSKPLIFNGIANSIMSAAEISMYADCYWDCAMRLYEMDRRQIPTIEKLCRLMGMSTSTFAKYQEHKDPNVREMVLMVRDLFIDFYTSKGLSGELEKIMTIFTLKARFGLRDNDVAPTVVNNNYTTEIHTDLGDIEKRYNLSGGGIIDTEV